MANLYGIEGPHSAGSDLNAAQLVWRKLMSGVWTAMLVQVKAVTVDNVVGPIGKVDIQPLIHQVDGQGSATPHETIYNAKYLRMAAATNAIIMDPQVNDVGVAVFCMRDMKNVINGIDNSNAKAGGSGQNTNNVANTPGSGRWFDPADAIYLYSVATLTQTPNQTPKQYIQFKEDDTTVGMTLSSDVCINLQAPYTDNGSHQPPDQYIKLQNGGTMLIVSGGANGAITIQSPDTNQTVKLNHDGTMALSSNSSITLTAPTINLNGAVVGNNTATFTGDVTGAGTHLHTHTHSGVTTGTGNTGAPN